MTSDTAEHRNPEWTFGDRVRKIRREAGLRQVEFAERIGRKHQSIAAWELGTNLPHDIVAVAQRIEMAFGVEATWVLGLNSEKVRPFDGPDGEVVRHQGLEPRTRWFEAIAS